MFRGNTRLTFLIVLGSLLAGVVGLGLYVLATPLGGQQALRVVLTRLIGPHELSTHSIEGTLLSGMSVHELSLHALREGADSSVLAASRVEIAPLAKLLQSSSAMVGHDLHAESLAGLPEGSSLDIQRLESGWPLRLDRLRSISNGRLRLPYSEPIVFSGYRRDRQARLDVYSKVVDVHEILERVIHVPAWVQVHGTLHDVHLTLSGVADELRVSGTLEVEKMFRQDVTLSRCPTTLSLVFEPTKRPWHLTGELLCRGGIVQAKQATVALQQALVTFSGDPSAPLLDIQGTARVGDTAMRIRLTGTTKYPQLSLTSDPPRAERVLLMMLVSGKDLANVQDTLAQGVISSDLATDAIDYFLFGGAGGRLGKRLGISGLSLTHDSQSNWVGVRAGLVDKLSVSFEIEPPGATGVTQAGSNHVQPPRAPLPYKVGAEVKITDQTSLQLEGERTSLEAHPPSASSSSGDTSGSSPQTDDKVLLRLKRKF